MKHSVGENVRIVRVPLLTVIRVAAANAAEEKLFETKRGGDESSRDETLCGREYKNSGTGLS